MFKKTCTLLPAVMICTALVSCSNPGQPMKAGLDAPVIPVGNYNTLQTCEYSDEGTPAVLISEYSTDDGLCTIKVYDRYYDVTLDEENGTPYEAGRAYAMALSEVCPEVMASMEPYIFENIRMAFPDIGDDYSAVEERMQDLFDSLDPNYQDEITGLCDELCGDARGLSPDGILSVEEMMLMQMVPDCLRPTSCSGLSLWGSKTATGDMISVRCLEWSLGSDNSMTRIHCLLHIRNGENSITNIGFLGLFDTISGINDNGVFMAILDAGSGDPYDHEGRTCYTFAVRHALEQFDNARDAGQYMIDNSPSFTYCHNIMITDGTDAFCAEDATAQVIERGAGFPFLRDAGTPIMNDVSWDSPDSLCIVNSFLSEGNYDNMSGEPANVIRFSKYNEWVSGTDVFTLEALKDMMTQETVDTRLYGNVTVQNVHRSNLTQMIIVDYHTGSIQIAFTGSEGVTDKPVFTDVGSYTGW